MRGGRCEAPEGPMKERHVVIEFPDFAAAQAAYRSEEYQENLKIRLANSVGDVVLLEGVDLATVDVSFISLALIVPALVPHLRPGAWLVCLVKPQFEVGKGQG